jgi:hypothetical protein
MNDIAFVIIGLFFIVFHKLAAHQSMEYWDYVGLEYDETFCGIFFIIVGSILVIASVLSMLGY